MTNPGEGSFVLSDIYELIAVLANFGASRMHFNASLCMITKNIAEVHFNYCDDFNDGVLDLLDHFINKPNFCSSSLIFSDYIPGKRSWAVV